MKKNSIKPFLWIEQWALKQIRQYCVESEQNAALATYSVMAELCSNNHSNYFRCTRKTLARKIGIRVRRLKTLIKFMVSFSLIAEQEKSIFLLSEDKYPRDIELAPPFILIEKEPIKLLRRVYEKRTKMLRSAIAVYAVICEAKSQSGSNPCYRYAGTLAKKSGVGVRQFHKIARELESQKLIQRIQRQNRSNRNAASEYRILSVEVPAIPLPKQVGEHSRKTGSDNSQVDVGNFTAERSDKTSGNKSQSAEFIQESLSKQESSYIEESLVFVNPQKKDLRTKDLPKENIHLIDDESTIITARELSVENQYPSFRNTNQNASAEIMDKAVDLVNHYINYCSSHWNIRYQRISLQVEIEFAVRILRSHTLEQANSLILENVEHMGRGLVSRCRGFLHACVWQQTQEAIAFVNQCINFPYKVTEEDIIAIGYALWSEYSVEDLKAKLLNKIQEGHGEIKGDGFSISNFLYEIDMEFFK